MRSDPAIWLANQFYTKLVGRFLPARWFGVQVPATDDLATPAGRLTIEIVSHCWQYAHLLTYQLGSLVQYAPKEVDIRYTLFYAEEDEKTVQLISEFSQIAVPGITWAWQPLGKEVLFRRAIGRHQAALETDADWLWYADCDLIFHRGCLDALAAVLRNQKCGLVYPAWERVTPLFPADHPWITDSLSGDLLVDIDPAQFSVNRIHKAKGAFQIVHGDVARTAGYCGSLGLYQQPDSRWRKTYEDTVFRNLIGFEGQPMEFDGLYRIRHASKGRYTSDSLLSKARGKIRYWTDSPG